MSFYNVVGAGLNKLRARWRACTQRARKELFACTKLRARKSVKTLLTSTPTLFKVVSYFCFWKQLIFGTIKSDIHNLFFLRSCCWISDVSRVFLGRPVHTSNPQRCHHSCRWAEKFSKFVLQMLSKCTPRHFLLLNNFVKHLSNYLILHYRTLLFVDFLKIHILVWYSNNKLVWL